MALLNLQDDEPWDDFSSTQLERVEFHAAVIKSDHDETTAHDSVFPFNSSKAAFNDFLDDLINPPIRSKIKKPPLGDITNQASTKDKKLKNTLVRMDSLDDSIWSEFDNDLLSLIDIEPSISLPNKMDEMFKKNHQSVETTTLPSFTTARGKVLPSPSNEASLKYAKLLETVDDVALPVSINEALFLPLAHKEDDYSLEQSKSNENVIQSNPKDTKCQINSDIYEDEDDNIPSYDDIFAPPASQHAVLPPPKFKFSSQTNDDKDIPSYDDLFMPPMYSYKTLPPQNRLPSQATYDHFSISPVSKHPSLIEKSHFTAANGAPSKPVSEKSKQEVIKLFNHENDNRPNGIQDSKKFDHAMHQFGGFQTGGGKKNFDISSQAKRKAISVFNDPEQVNKRTRLDPPRSEKMLNITTIKENYNRDIIQFGGFQMGGSKQTFDISSQAERNAIFVLDKPVEKTSSFIKASGAPVNPPSQKGVETATTLLKDNTSQYKSDIVQFGGFQTGNSKKSFDISSQATRKAISIFDEPAPVEQAKFITASGSSIPPPSEKGKQSAASLFQDTKQYKNDINQFGGFQTGSSKMSFDISSQAARKAISVFESTEEPTPNTVSEEAQKYADVMDQFGGFQTGGGRKNFELSSQAKRTAISVLNETQLELPLLEDVPELTVDTILYTPKTAKPEKLTEPCKPVLTAPALPKRNISRPSVITRQNKPFKSPIIQSNFELTKAAVINRATSKTKLTPVFDLKATTDRHKLSSLGEPCQFSKSQLIAKNIHISVLQMTAYTAKRYYFDMKWGPKEARNDLIKAGAASHRVSLEWVENHYGWIVWKLACMVRSYPDQFLAHWKSQYVLDQLLYRYEREINMGHRPVLRRILEKDDLPVKHMILVISDIVEIKSALQYGTSSKYRIQLSDGWYQVPTCIDLRMEHAITKNKLKIGSKLSICGASMIGEKEGIHPLENTDSGTLLSITTNSSLPARWDAKLGYHPKKLITRSIQTIFDDGGTVTALDIIVCRKFPILYCEVLPNGSIITRNAKEEEEARRIALGFGSYGTRQPKLENLDRRVSGYFKLRICDARSSPDQQLATLMLSNANELNHMDISEGNRYKVFFVIPYYSKNKKYPGLDLKTTRITRWEPAPVIQQKNAYVPRFLSACGDIRSQEPSSDFDLVVLVLQTGPATSESLNGRKLWHQTLLVTDESQAICQIDFRLPMNPFPDIQGQVFGLMNLRFEMYDAKFDITRLKATDESESVTKVSSASEYIQKGIHDLKKWVSDNPDQVQSLTDRVYNLVQ